MSGRLPQSVSDPSPFPYSIVTSILSCLFDHAGDYYRDNLKFYCKLLLLFI